MYLRTLPVQLSAYLCMHQSRVPCVQAFSKAALHISLEPLLRRRLPAVTCTFCYPACRAAVSGPAACRLPTGDIVSCGNKLSSPRCFAHAPHGLHPAAAPVCVRVTLQCMAQSGIVRRCTTWPVRVMHYVQKATPRRSGTTAQLECRQDRLRCAPLQPGRPVEVARVVDGVDLPARGDAQARVREHELAAPRVQREPVRAVAQRQHDHRGGRVQRVRGRDQPAARLQRRALVCARARSPRAVSRRLRLRRPPSAVPPGTVPAHVLRVRAATPHVSCGVMPPRTWVGVEPVLAAAGRFDGARSYPPRNMVLCDPLVHVLREHASTVPLLPLPTVVPSRPLPLSRSCRAGVARLTRRHAGTGRGWCRSGWTRQCCASRPAGRTRRRGWLRRRLQRRPRRRRC